MPTDAPVKVTATQQDLDDLQFGQSLSRGFRRRCPLCGRGRLFCGLLKMNKVCAECGFLFERPPGYFLGSTYINYGVTALITTASFVVLQFGFGWPRNTLLLLLLPFCVIFPVVFFAIARSVWLSLDCWFDRVGAAEALPAEDSTLKPEVKN